MSGHHSTELTGLIYRKSSHGRIKLGDSAYDGNLDVVDQHSPGAVLNADAELKLFSRLWNADENTGLLPVESSELLSVVGMEFTVGTLHVNHDFRAEIRNSGFGKIISLDISFDVKTVAASFFEIERYGHQ